MSHLIVSHPDSFWHDLKAPLIVQGDRFSQFPLPVGEQWASGLLRSPGKCWWWDSLQGLLAPPPTGPPWPQARVQHSPASHARHRERGDQLGRAHVVMGGHCAVWHASLTQHGNGPTWPGPPLWWGTRQACKATSNVSSLFSSSKGLRLEQSGERPCSLCAEHPLRPCSLQESREHQGLQQEGGGKNNLTCKQSSIHDSLDPTFCLSTHTPVLRVVPLAHDVLLHADGKNPQTVWFTQGVAIPESLLGHAPCEWYQQAEMPYYFEASAALTLDDNLVCSWLFVI